MKLLKATYRNFKGLKDYTFEPRRNNTTVRGDNGTYKTTLYDGILWLLFGKDSQNLKNFDIKTLTPDGQPIHNLEHEVEAEFDLNGKPLLLKKRFTEKWTRKRGTATDEFTGHTTEHFIHGVPASAGEYADKIASICDENTFKLLTSPSFFNNDDAMKTKDKPGWKVRRDIIIDVCGDVSDGDVIASDKALKELPGILGDRSIDDHKKMINAQKAAINKELEKIPVRIDEAERALPDVKGLSEKALTTERVAWASKMEAKQAEISRIKNGGEVAEKTKALRELESELLDIKNKHRAAVDEQVSGKQIELSDLKIKVDNYHRILKNAERERADTLTLISDTEKEAAELRAQWHEVNGNEFTFEQDENCPSCGQALPTEKLGEAREKALAAFNRQKAGLLEEISAKGRKCKASIVMLRAEGEGLTKIIQDTQANLDLLIDGDAKKLQAEIDTITASATDPTESSDYKAALSRIKTLDSEISDLQVGTNELLTMAQEEADTIREQIQAVDDDLKKFTDRTKGETRIKELAAEEKKLAKEFERLEKELYLTEQFTRAKVNLLEDKINSKFKYARFRLFSEQINGGLSEVCEATYGGVPYSTGLNRGHKIIVGMDIISTLSEHYKFAPVIFVDDAESVTRLPEMKAQVIRLVKPEIETEEKAKTYSKLVVDVEGEQNTLFGEEV